MKQPEGIVTGVHEGESGFASVSLRTAVAEVPEGTHVTFSLSDWNGSCLPRKGQVVSLREITLFEKGWRALGASPIRLTDHQKKKGAVR